MDDLIDLMTVSMIEKAMERVLHRFEFPITSEHGIGTDAMLRLRIAARENPTVSPVGVLIKANTKKHPRSAIGILAVVVRALTNSGLVRQDQIREFHFSRLSSFEETAEIYLVALDD
jgi:hypothetical protein